MRLLRLAVLAFVVLFVAVTPVSADDDLWPEDYCFRTDILITNNSGTDLEDFGVRVEHDAATMVANTYIDAVGTDLKPTIWGYSTEAEVFVQELDAHESVWWYHVPQIADGASVTIRDYSGNDEQKRDNGIFFTGSDEVSVAHAAGFNITDDLAIEVDLELDDATPQDATLLSHWNANVGYKMELADDGGVLKIVTTIDNQPGAVNWSSAWTGETTHIRSVFNNPNLETFVDGVSLGVVNTGLGAISATSTPVLIGTSLSNATIRSASVRSGADGAGNETLEGYWGFSPGSTGALGCIDTSAAGATSTFTGTCQDASAQNRDATYTFNRGPVDLVDDIVVVVGATSWASLPALLTYDEELFDTLGDPFGTVDMVPTALAGNTRMGYSLVRPLIEDMGMPTQMAWLLILGALGLMLMGGAYMITRNVVLALGVSAMPVFVGAINQWLAPWVLVVWAALAIVLWGTHRWAEA